jgi:hypothetical protein
VRLVVSTVLEAEQLLPLLKEYQAAGRSVNVRKPCRLFFALALSVFPVLAILMMIDI